MNNIVTIDNDSQKEADMFAIKNLFERAANAIVDATSLAKEVRELRQQVQEITADTQRLREHIKWLEEENNTLREQRDTAQREVAEMKEARDHAIQERTNVVDEVASLVSQRDTARGDASFWESEAKRMELDLHNVRVERDRHEHKLNRILEVVQPLIRDTEQARAAE